MCARLSRQVKHHGSVAASAANVIRKIIAVGFSFLYFGRPITAPIALGTLLVFGSIIWRAYVHESHAPPVPAGTAKSEEVEVDQNPEAAGEDYLEGDEEEEAVLLSHHTNSMSAKGSSEMSNRGLRVS